MKLYTKILLGLVVVFGAVIPLLLTGPDGKAVMRISDWLPGGDRLLGLVREAGVDLSAMKSGDSETTEQDQQVPGRQVPGQSAPEKAPVAKVASMEPQTATSGKMYKWQDEQGHWHFSTEKPGGVGNASQESLPQVKNVMDAPVDKESNGSMMGLSGMGGAGELLEKVKQMAAERDKKE